jgi:hypothetical protein
MTEVRLEPTEWSQVLQILANAPWAVANPLIMKIGEQLRQADVRPTEGQPRPNSGEHKVEH